MFTTFIILLTEKNKENTSRSIVTQNEDDVTSVIDNNDKEASLADPGDGWSQWDKDDGQKENQYLKDDSDDKEIDYDQEIEDELLAMDFPQRVATLREITEPGSPVAVDWSDSALVEQAEVKAGSKTRGMLKLKSKSKQSPPPKAKSTTLPEKEWAEGDWGFQEENHHVTVTPRKSSSPKVKGSWSRQGHVDVEGQQDGWVDDWGNDSHDEASSTMSPSHNQEFDPGKERERRPSGKPENELGAEFDIMSIKVKPKNEKESDRFDFFSDMEPVIAMKNPLAELLERSDSKEMVASREERPGNKTNDASIQISGNSRDEAQQSAHSRLSFAVVETNEVSSGICN